MQSTSPHEITLLLARIREGDLAAADQLMPIVYQQLRRLARGYLQKERFNHTLQPTALVHEAYLRLFNVTDINDPLEIQNREHFFVVAARQMRRILVDYSRAKSAEKREGGLQRVEFSEVDSHTSPPDIDYLALDLALRKLEETHPRPARIVELRYFGGLTEKETAEALAISVSTLKREWEFARAWLFKQLKSS
jgi:RNA polymerase sigma factor (TIGR02999 family)